MHLPEIDFSSLEIKEIGTWPFVLRVAVIAAAVIVAMVATYFLVFDSELITLSDTQKKLEDKKKEFKDQYTQAINLDAFKAQMEQMQSAYREYVNELPSASNIPELIDTLTKIGERSGLVFSSIKIGEPKLVAGFYMMLPLTINVTGTYHNFGIFVSEVAKMSRIVTVSDFAIKPTGGSGSGAGSGASKGAGQGANATSTRSVVPGLLSMTVETQTYWLASVSEIQQQTKTPDTKKQGRPGAAGKPGAAAPAPPAEPGAPTSGVAPVPGAPDAAAAPGAPSAPATPIPPPNPKGR